MYQVITSNFVHYNYFHMALNLALFVPSARFIELRFGSWVLLLLLLLCGMIGSVYETIAWYGKTYWEQRRYGLTGY